MSLAKRFIARTILAKVYANDKCARRFYAPLPVEPYGPSAASDWAKPNRPSLPEYVKGLVHYELAVEQDAPRIVDFLLRHIIPNSPLINSLGTHPDELLDFYTPVVEHSLKERCSLLGFVGDDLVGVSLHSIRNVRPSPNAQFTKADILPTRSYAPEINAAPFKSRAAKKLHVFVELLRHKFEELLPGARKVMVIELGGVANKYRGRGISLEMVTHSLRLAHDQFHCDHVVVVADSKPAQKLLEQKLQFVLLRELKLDHFLDGEAPAFPEETNSILSGKLLAKRL